MAGSANRGAADAGGLIGSVRPGPPGERGPGGRLGDPGPAACRVLPTQWVRLACREQHRQALTTWKSPVHAANVNAFCRWPREPRARGQVQWPWQRCPPAHTVGAPIATGCGSQASRGHEGRHGWVGKLFTGSARASPIAFEAVSTATPVWVRRPSCSTWPYVRGAASGRAGPLPADGGPVPA